MDTNLKAILWQQLGASIDMLENAVHTCPDDLWGDASRKPENWHECWYLTYHTLFFLDLDASDTADGFRPPSPFGLEELDPAGVLPDRVYSKAELLAYLEHGREKWRAAVAALTGESALGPSPRRGLNRLEVLLQSVRHVQHHTAQLNLLIRQSGIDAPPWVRRSKFALGDAGV